MDGDRSRSGTSSAPDLVSPLPPSNKDNASQLPSARSSVPKKPRDGRVRFVEQKKLYFYTDETPPSETLDILNGFVTALGLPEDEVRYSVFAAKWSSFILTSAIYQYSLIHST
jgi:hypothetical protein